MEIVNRRAKFDYNLEEQFEVGIVLTGEEVKAVRTGGVDLAHSHGKIIGGELFLVGGVFSLTSGGDGGKSRKLLVHRQQVLELTNKMNQKKLVLVPVKLFFKGRLVKLRLALAKSKKKYEKRAALKKREESKISY